MTEGEAKVGQQGLWFFFEIMVLIHEELNKLHHCKRLLLH